MIVQIVLMDIIFSLDSVITAVGMVEQGETEAQNRAAMAVMITAILIAVGVMLIFARTVSDFVSAVQQSRCLHCRFSCSLA